MLRQGLSAKTKFRMVNLLGKKLTKRRLILYGVRLRKDQLDFLRTKDNASEWVRDTIDTQIAFEKEREARLFVRNVGFITKYRGRSL